MSNDAEVRARAFDAGLDLKLRLAAKGIDLTDDARTIIDRAFLAFAAEARSHDGECICPKCGVRHGGNMAEGDW